MMIIHPWKLVKNHKWSFLVVAVLMSIMSTIILDKVRADSVNSNSNQIAEKISEAIIAPGGVIPLTSVPLDTALSLSQKNSLLQNQETVLSNVFMPQSPLFDTDLTGYQTALATVATERRTQDIVTALDLTSLTIKTDQRQRHGKPNFLLPVNGEIPRVSHGRNLIRRQMDYMEQLLWKKLMDNG